MNFFHRAKLSRRDSLDYLKNKAKSGNVAVLVIRFRVWASGKRSKIDPATDVRFQQKMFMFLTEKTKTNFIYVGCYMSVIRNAHGLYVCSMSSLTKHVENVAARPGSLKGSRLGENSFENLYVQIVCYEIGYQIRRANLHYRLPQKSSFRRRGSKPCFSIEICQNSLSERP